MRRGRQRPSRLSSYGCIYPEAGKGQRCIIYLDRISQILRSLPNHRPTHETRFDKVIYFGHFKFHSLFVDAIEAAHLSPLLCHQASQVAVVFRRRTCPQRTCCA